MTAGMAAIIRVILIIVVIYYLIRFLDKYLIPSLFGKPKDKQPKKGKKSKIDGGEYVDYEEIE